MHDCCYRKYLIVNLQIEKCKFIEQLHVCSRVTARFKYFDRSFYQMALSSTNLKREEKTDCFSRIAAL